jgi:dTDP-4-dehydrorhamnose reductase
MYILVVDKSSARSAKRLLITGASGLVGGHVAREAALTWEVHGTCRNHCVSWPGIRMYGLLLEDEQRVLSLVREVRPDVIIHAAAWTDVDACSRQPELAIAVNTSATAVLAGEAAALGARLIYLSSDMVFDGNKGLYDESDRPNPLNLYGQTKLDGEKAVLSSRNSVVARVALVYGKPVALGNSFSEKMLEEWKRGESVSLFTDQFRSPVWVNDLARALLELAGHEFCGLVHLGGSVRIDRYTFGLALAEKYGFSPNLLRPVSLSGLKNTARRPRDVSFSISRAKALLKSSLSGYNEGISQMII